MRLVAGVFVAASLAALTACAGADPAPPVSTTPSATTRPLFASEEEALAAAKEAYEEYLRVSDEIARDGGQDAERLAPLVTDEEFERAVPEFETFAESQRRFQGTSQFDNVSLQQYADHAGRAHVSIYLCLDVSQVRVLDESGNDITPARDSKQPLNVKFISQRAGSERLLLDGSDQWSSNFCE